MNTYHAFKIILLIVGIFMLAVGFALRFWIGRRQYNRRNFPVAPVKSYTGWLKTRFFEDVISFMYYFMLIVGAIIVVGATVTLIHLK